MRRPSEPLLALLRNILKDRGMNSSQAAREAGIKKARMRRVLAGVDAMTVDELIGLSNALELSPNELGLPEDPPAEPDETPPIALAEEAPERQAVPVDPWGNHPRQLFEVGFGLGIDFAFEIAVEEIADSGVPAQVLQQFAGRSMLITLDSAYHDYNEAELHDELHLTLSFDALYRCRFPWSAIRRVIFTPAPPEEVSEEPTPPPGLRLVT